MRAKEFIIEARTRYYEIEFVCVNPQFDDATDEEIQKKLYYTLQTIPGVIPLWQEWGEYSEGQKSLSAIFKDRAARSAVLRAAKQLGVTVDLEQEVDDEYVDRAIRGEHEGQLSETETYQPPKLAVGDKILKGKFKNSPAEIKGFTKDKHNQPVLKTNKGEVQLFKPRISKLMKENAGTTVTLEQLYGGNYPDRDETFWDYVSQSELDNPLSVQTMQRHLVQIMLLSQYRAEHIDDITDMLDDEQQEIVQAYENDPALSSKVIVVADNRIIDGNHRALAAAIKGVPINYVDLSELDA